MEIQAWKIPAKNPWKLNLKKSREKTRQKQISENSPKFHLEKNGECIKRDILETDFFAPLEHK